MPINGCEVLRPVDPALRTNTRVRAFSQLADMQHNIAMSVLKPTCLLTSVALVERRAGMSDASDTARTDTKKIAFIFRLVAPYFETD